MREPKELPGKTGVYRRGRVLSLEAAERRYGGTLSHALMTRHRGAIAATKALRGSGVIGCSHIQIFYEKRQARTLQGVHVGLCTRPFGHKNKDTQGHRYVRVPAKWFLAAIEESERKMTDSQTPSPTEEKEEQP